MKTGQSFWKRLSPYLLAFALILAAYLASLVGGAGAGCVTSPSSDRVPAAVSEAQPQQNQSVGIGLGSLPAEAGDTLRLIKRGGPFPYSKDGTVFNNYEGLLPAKPTGYYHEYTVITPGSPDRGARRIIAGGPGEYYYTGDHYRSFQRILEQ